MHATTTTAEPTRSPAAAWPRRLASLCDRRFPGVILFLVLVAGVVRIAILREFLLENPFAEFPTLDGELYWNRAGEMAAGDWIGDAPFHIAPLYTYLLAVLRRAGGDLATLYGIQTAIHLVTAALVGIASRQRFGSVAGCAATAIFLGLAEPALLATRVLGATLQLLIVSLLWLDWARLADDEAPGRLHVARVGVLIGLFALAFPAALLLVPVYTAWILLRSGIRGFDWRRATLGAASALVVIGSATLHNAIVANEFIPITSHAGITLAAGNGPGSVGIFTPLSETHNNVKDQAHESALAYEEATGRSGSWREIDGYYRDRVIEWWVSNPLDAAVLFARKAWWFLTSRHYDNVTAFELESRHGLQDAARGVPIETPWILGLVLLGAGMALPRPRRFVPEIALVAVPFAICLAFMYSARYRAVALPVLCGLAGFALAHWRSAPRPRAALAAAIALPVLLLGINAATGFGSIDFMSADFASLLADGHQDVARARVAEHDMEAAEAALRSAADADPSRTAALRELAALQLADDRPADARSSALAAVRRDTSDERAHRLLYDAQILTDDYRNAEITLNLIEMLDPADGDVQLAMAWFYSACPAPSWRSGKRSLVHAGAAERLIGSDDPEVVMVRALAEAADGDFDAARLEAERGRALAVAAGDEARSADFEALQQHFRDHKIVASRPRLLAGKRN